MLRKILSTTALVAVVSAGAAYAQDATNTDTMDKKPAATTGMEAGMETGATPVFPERQAASEDAKSFFGATDQQVLASSLLGWPVYGQDADDQGREQVGDINDIVMGSDGNATAAVIGVGGFLGIGEKDVAVSFDRLGWQQGEEGNWLTINATSEELENAPSFEYDNPNLLENGTAAIREEADQLQTATNNAANNVANETQDLANTAGNAMNQAGEAAGNAMDDMVAGVDQMGENAAETMNAENPMLEGMSEVDMASVSFDQLEDAAVLSAEGDRVGEVSSVMTHGDQSENILVVDVGGFLGIGEKPVAISADSARIMSDGENYVVKTSYDRETLENQPEFSEQALNDNPDAVLLN
ncbi:PRC-barrel domain-containing protein [Martelella radicis]|uniref:Sporulation protein YlmC with PRC-barrel domain n=1 Tax=Martelella radicis TaxID=1397476 RepID=A0A7W6KL15_9HYPH|nr:PRC-barrel domain-containing protein [Martelella radicis]MBB4122985.1 sporulation protein YlmC with PRC-barrel domain [Martelella radicis]